MTAHQDLLEQGKLVAQTSDLVGRMVFMSHQWLGFKFPDPNNEQLTALKRVLTRLMQGEIPSVIPDWKTTFIFPELGTTLTVEAARWEAALPHMLLWLDYSGIPGITVRDAND